MKYSFCNDYSEFAHPVILDALLKASHEQNTGYGLDVHSLHAKALIQEIFHCPEADVHFLNGGTQTNMVFISYALRPYEAALCVEGGHINVHETGAVEGSGHKVITEKGKDGKLSPEDILHALKVNDLECHMAKIKLVYISDSTECGTIYTKDELIALSKVCKEHDLYLFLDGARLSSALGARDNDLLPEDIAKYTDAFYVGGTKIGFLNGEALVIVNKELQKNFRFHIKNKGAMNAKGFVYGLQFEAMLESGTYFALGKKENELAYYLEEELTKRGITFASRVATNQVFVNLPNPLIAPLMKDYLFEVWSEGEETSVCRFVISWATEKASVDMLLEDMDKLLKRS